jgi:2-keto-3-deoxy-L-rhamnonate aldolase RhmA
MPATQNPVRELLQKGQTAVGIVISVNSIEVAAQAAALGFDFLWLEMEHTPLSLETVRNIVLATRGLPAVPFARPPVNELWMAKRVLDAGVLGVIFPFTSTPELARQAAAACRYPPLGFARLGR